MFKVKYENHRAEPCATDNDHSCHGSCCARSAPAAVMSDLKRSAMNAPIKIRAPMLFGYSAILPAVWISVCLVLNLLVPGLRLGTVGTALIFMGVASLVGWLFARRHHRQFTNAEYWKIILYCYLWALFFEFFVLFAVVVLPQIEAGHVDAKPLMFVVPFTMVLDALFVWLAFRQAGRKTIDAYLAKAGQK